MSRRPRLRSVRTKLVLVFFAIIAAAFGLLYFIATPQLETKLEQRQLDDIRSSAQDVRPRLKAWITADQLKEKELNEHVRGIGEDTDARVTLLGVAKHGLLYTQSDSRTEKDAPFSSELAKDAIATRHARTAIGPLAGQELAQVAQPFFGGRKHRKPVAVAFYARDLNDVAEAVDLVRNRVLVAT
ncbi:MAG: hypothetical protein QOE60_1540, partial [Thermoleophilaceae bacterium]|nr:hypothetical protein [Thermoleophilaceae bacterium]